ncbi:MAG: histidinol phosphate phosphatase domain-containing protein [Candidatus Schekmanbacteria bacterium]|nr:histidinol phosphate phosphatase domain-containing protein [Candidatus Schekmanbacteria bacterium]
MFDFHTHSLFSDGVLLPMELIRHAVVKGYKAIALTDHADPSNLEFVIPRIIQACQTANQHWEITAIPGIELTHVPPKLIPDLAYRARSLGAKIIVVHGETIAEPVVPGTNHYALKSDIDILAHPGLISEEDVRLAAKRHIFLEITSRKGHSLTNGHVAKLAAKSDASLILDTDSHEPDDLISQEQAIKVAIGAGLTESQIEQIWVNARNLVHRCNKKA